MKTKIHAAAATLALVFLATFWLSTLVAELFLSDAAVAAVKLGIAYALLGFVPVVIATGGSGFALARGSAQPLVGAKRRRMPVIAGLGVVVLAPAAIFLSVRAQAGLFDRVFYGVQALELIVGAVNLTLIGLNFRDGLRLRERRLRPA